MNVNVYPTLGVNYIQIKNARTSADFFTLNVPGEQQVLLGFRGVNNDAVKSYLEVHGGGLYYTASDKHTLRV